MTNLQEHMINKIARSEFSEINGCVPMKLSEIGSIWADTIIEVPEDKGVFTSLLKAGLVFHTGPNDPDAGCGLTEEGFVVYLSIKDKF